MGKQEVESQRRCIELTKEAKYEEALELLLLNDSYKSHPVSMGCYALCKATLEFDIKGMEKLCRQALRLERDNPIIYLCMGRIYLLFGDKGLAYKVFRYGLKYSRKNKELQNELSIFGTRRPVLFSSHKRDHFLNKCTGVVSLWLAMDITRYLPFTKKSGEGELKRVALR